MNYLNMNIADFVVELNKHIVEAPVYYDAIKAYYEICHAYAEADGENMRSSLLALRKLNLLMDVPSDAIINNRNACEWLDKVIWEWALGLEMKDE